MIKKLKELHISEVVKIHKRCFPDAQSTKFGDNFLRSFYIGHVESPNAVCYVYEIGERKIAGFITGGINIKKLSRQIAINSKFSFAFSFFMNFVKNPINTSKTLIRYVKAYIIKKPENKTFYKDNTAGLGSLAISSDCRRRGIGEKLVKVFLKELANKKVVACRLGVDANNLSARKFYEKLGFIKLNDEGNSYIYNL